MTTEQNSEQLIHDLKQCLSELHDEALLMMDDRKRLLARINELTFEVESLREHFGPELRAVPPPPTSDAPDMETDG